MEWITGPGARAAAFQVQQSKFILTEQVMSKQEVQNSGLACIARKEGFKDTPPAVPRTEDGAFILNRNPEAFELLVEHLLGLQPLESCSMSEFAEKYILLKSELLYWQLPTLDVSFKDSLFYDTAWTDEACFYPLSPKDAAAFSKEEVPEVRPQSVVELTKLSEAPEEFSGLLVGSDQDWTTWSYTPSTPAAADLASAAVSNRLLVTRGAGKFLCKLPGMADPSIHYSALPMPENFVPFAILVSPFEATIVWTEGVFIHVSSQEKSGNRQFRINVMIREPSWVCVHPTLGIVLSGVEGPVPNVFCLDSRGAEVVRFFPWGVLVVNKTAECPSQRKRDAGAGLVEPSVAKGLLDFVTGFNKESVSEFIPPIPAVAGTIMRMRGKSFQSPIRICFLNVDAQEGVLTLRSGTDFDLLDMRNDEATDFNVVVANRGALASRRPDEIVEDKKSGARAVVFQFNNKGEFAGNTPVLISNGGPTGERLCSIALYGEYHVESRKYFTLSTGKKLFDFHRSMFMMRQGAQGTGCNVM